jgi:hypothetical protein
VGGVDVSCEVDGTEREPVYAAASADGCCVQHAYGCLEQSNDSNTRA